MYNILHALLAVTFVAWSNLLTNFDFSLSVGRSVVSGLLGPPHCPPATTVLSKLMYGSIAFLIGERMGGMLMKSLKS